MPEPEPTIAADIDQADDQADDRDWFGTRADLPFPGLERATSVLRGQLRTISDRAEAAGPARILDWETLSVEGPIERTDPDGRSWYTYTATVGTRPIRPLDPPASPTPDITGATT